MTFIVIGIFAIMFGLLVWDGFRPRKFKPSKEDYEWGESKDLSQLAVRHNLPLPNSPFEELEEWWLANESKDARIKELETRIWNYQTEYDGLPSKSYASLMLDIHTEKIQYLEKTIRELETENKKAFLASLSGGPVDIPDNPWVTTTLTFRGKELREWEQHMEKDLELGYLNSGSNQYHQISSIAFNPGT